MTGPSDPRYGSADLHLHTMASDGTASALTMLERAEALGLDVIAITDHDRIDAAVAARAISAARNMHVQVIVGEEVSTLQGHLLALFISERVRPLRSLRRTIAEIHEQGGIAIPAHPLFPHFLCTQEGALRSVAADRDPACHPDAIEGYNPTIFGKYVRGRVNRLAAELSIPIVGNSDAHVPAAVGRAWTSFPGSTADELRAAILSGTTRVGGGSDHTLSESPGIFARQMARNIIGVGQDLAGQTRPIWGLGAPRRGRDLGYPGGRHRPPRLDHDEIAAESYAELGDDGESTR